MGWVGFDAQLTHLGLRQVAQAQTLFLRINRSHGFVVSSHIVPTGQFAALAEPVYHPWVGSGRESGFVLGKGADFVPVRGTPP